MNSEITGQRAEREICLTRVEFRKRYKVEGVKDFAIGELIIFQ